LVGNAVKKAMSGVVKELGKDGHLSEKLEDIEKKVDKIDKGSSGNVEKVVKSVEKTIEGVKDGMDEVHKDLKEVPKDLKKVETNVKAYTKKGIHAVGKATVTNKKYLQAIYSDLHGK